MTETNPVPDGSSLHVGAIVQELSDIFDECSFLLSPKAPFQAAVYQREVNFARTKVEEAQLWLIRCMSIVDKEYPPKPITDTPPANEPVPAEGSTLNTTVPS